MSTKPQERALKNYRKCLNQRGMARFEAPVRREGRPGVGAADGRRDGERAATEPARQVLSPRGTAITPRARRRLQRPRRLNRLDLRSQGGFRCLPSSKMPTARLEVRDTGAVAAGCALS
jgi:hypothetical protein